MTEGIPRGHWAGMERPHRLPGHLLALALAGALVACAAPPEAPARTTPDASSDVAAEGATPGDVIVSDVTGQADSPADDRASGPDAPSAPDATEDTAALGDAPVDDARDAGGQDAPRADGGAPDVTTSDVAADGAGDGGGRTFADGGAPSAEFLALYDDIFGPRCGACHGARAGATTNLHMPDPVTAHANLVNQPVRCVAPGGRRDGELRVAPGDLDASVLPAPYEVCGMRHTGTGQMIAAPDEVARVRAWIAGGAR